VIGIESAKQLKELLNEATKIIIPAPDNLALNDPDLINPSNWSRF
jgi:hypothetical protein